MISLLEAYSPACTAPRTAWAISAVSVMVIRSMVLMSMRLSWRCCEEAGFRVSVVVVENLDDWC